MLCCGQNEIRIRSARGSLYEKAASKATSAEPPHRWAIGTGQLSCLQFRSGPIARRGGGGIIPFGSASTTLSLLCSPGHGGYKKEQISLTLFHASLWANRGQNEVCPWQLYQEDLLGGICCGRKGRIYLPITLFITMRS